VSFFQFSNKSAEIHQSMVLHMNNIWYFIFTSSFFDLFFYYFKGFYYGMVLGFGSPFNFKCSLFDSRVLLSLMGFSIF